MRKTICIEGDEYPINGRIIEKGALGWPEDKKLPLCWSFNHDIEHVLGNASDLRREEDGRITAELTFNDSEAGQNAKAVLEHGDASATIYANQLVEDRKSKRVSAATIRSVEVVVGGLVPW
jgi:hypothetical protein